MEVYINSKNARLKVKMFGDGEAIIFLQGVRGSELRRILPNNEKLAQDFELVFYEHEDQSGDTALSLQDEVEILNELRLELGLEEVHLFGESWGTILALLYAMHYPEHVKKVFLTGAIGASNESFSLFESELNERATDDNVQKLMELAEHLYQGYDTVDNIFHMLDPYYVYSSQVKDSSMMSMNEVVNKEVGVSRKDHFDIRDDLAKLQDIPVLVAQGKHDIISPEKIQAHLIDYLPKVSLVEIEEAGHWTIVDQPEQIIDLAKTFFSDSQVH